MRLFALDILKMNFNLYFTGLIVLNIWLLVKCDVQINVVQVPRYYTPFDDDLYLSGTFNDWSLKHPKFKFKKLSQENFSIRLSLTPGDYEYKLTRGSPNTFETNTENKNFTNRKLTVAPNGGDQLIDVKIEQWEDMVGNHTADGNVFVIRSKIPYPQFNTTKHIYIYLPPDYMTTNNSYPVIYLQDGIFNFDSYLYSPYGELEADETMQKLANEGKQVSILVSVETVENRVAELTPFSSSLINITDQGKGDLYLDFLINDLKPYIDSNFRTKPDRVNTGLLGYSLGGLITLYAGLKYQDVFSKLGIFSGSFWWNTTIFDWAQQNMPKYWDTKFYFTAGTLENGVAGNGNFVNMSADLLKMIDLFERNGHGNQTKYVISEADHDYDQWRPQFPLAYSWFFDL